MNQKRYQTIISSAELYDNLNTPDWLILDCRDSLQNNEDKYQFYLENHIPNARYCCIHDACPELQDKGLSKHNVVLEDLKNSGMDQDTQIILYGYSCQSYINKIWLYLRSIGYKDTAVLHGGVEAWLDLNFPLTNFEEDKQYLHSNNELNKKNSTVLH